MKIRPKIMIIFLLLSLVPLIIIGMISYKSGEETIKKNLGAAFQQIAHETINKVDIVLSEVSQNVNAWSEQELMQEVITGDVDGKISSFIAGLGYDRGHFAVIDVINEKGEVVASSDPQLIGSYVLDEDYFKMCVNGHAHRGDVKYEKSVNNWVVDFSFPIKAEFEEEKIIGVLSAKWKADDLYNIIHYKKKIPGTQYYDHVMYDHIILMRKDGLIICAPEFMRNDAFKRNLIEEGLAAAFLARDQQEGYIVEIVGGANAIIGYDYSVGYGAFPGLGWAALVVEDAKTAFEPIERLKMIIIAMCCGVALIIVVVSIFITRKIANPILEISHVANKVSQGDFDGKVNYISSDEIGILAASFNQMIYDLREQKKQLVDKEYVDNIIKSMGDSLIVINPGAIIKTSNQTTLNILGYEMDELVGAHIGKVFGAAQTGAGVISDLLQKDYIKSEERVYLAKDGRKIPVIFSSAVMHDLQGNVLGIVCVAHDISARKELEAALEAQRRELEVSNEKIGEKNSKLEELLLKFKESQSLLIHSEKMSATGVVVAGIAHELNNPMMGILNFIQYCIETAPAKDERYEILQDAERATKLCIGIVENLLTFSRRDNFDNNNFREADCREIIDRVLNLLGHQIRKEKITVTKDYAAESVKIWATEGNMQQVFLNIINNAVYAVSGRESRDIHIKLRSGSKFVNVSIADTGTGIDAKDMPKILDPFFSTKPAGKGTGLGLSITHTIIENHNGTLDCKSEPGKGTVFNISLPLCVKK